MKSQRLQKFYCLLGVLLPLLFVSCGEYLDSLLAESLLESQTEGSPPSGVRNITSSAHTTNGFTVSWESPANGGTDSDGNSLNVVSYYVSWKKREETDYLSSGKIFLTKYSITGLEQGKEYDVLIQAKNESHGKNSYNYGEEVSSWTASVPGEVANIDYSDWSNVGDNTVSFVASWDTPIRFGKMNDGSGKNYSEISYLVKLYDASSKLLYTYNGMTKEKIRISGIDRRKKFYLMVVASNNIGLSPAVSGRVVSTPSLPGPVSGITVTDYKTNGFTLSWDAPSYTGLENDGSGSNAVITGYKIAYRANSIGVFITNGVLAGTSESLTGLLAGTPYEVQIIAENAFGEGVPHDSLRVWTGSLPDSIGTITVAPGAVSIMASWSDVIPGKVGKKDDGNGNAMNALTSYIVEYKEAIENAPYQQFAITTETSVNIINLTLGKTYQLRVTASNEYGSSYATVSDPVTTKSLAELPSVPGKVKVGFEVENSVTLSWSTPTNTGKEPNGNLAKLTKYILQYSNAVVGNWVSLSDTGNGIKLSDGLGTNTTATVLGLGKRWIYAFRVSAVNGTGMSDYTDPLIYSYSWPQQVFVFSPSSRLITNQSVKMTTFFLPNRITWADLTWSSSDTSIVKVLDNRDGTAQVTAYNSGTAVITASFMDKSDSVTVTVLPVAPTNFREIYPCQRLVTLIWNESPGAERYELYQVNNGINTLKAITASNYYTVEGLTPETHYTYSVKSCIGSDCSASSSLKFLTRRSTDNGNDLAAIISSGQVPANLKKYDELSRNVFKGYSPNISVIPRYVRPGGTGNKSGTDWYNASDSLRTVLQRIGDASLTRVYVVLLAPGVYKAGDSISMKNFVTIVGRVSTCNFIPADDKEVTILSGENSYQVFYNNRATSVARLNGVTIADGKADNGGGMMNIDAVPSLTEVIFSENYSLSGGGGMYNRKDTRGGIGTLVLKNVTFSKNTSGTVGGAIIVSSSIDNDKYYSSLDNVIFSENTSASNGGAMYSVNSTLTLRDVIFSDNLAGSDEVNNFIGQGGAIYLDKSSLSMARGSFLGNLADAAGAIFAKESSVEMKNVAISENMAVEGYGGGMYNEVSTLKLEDVILSENRAVEGYGGGIYSENTDLKLKDVVISENFAAESGGGMASLIKNKKNNNLYRTFGVSLANVVLYKNFANQKGGGFYNIGGVSPLILNNVAFSNNYSAGDGGGMYDFTAVGSNVQILKNVIFLENEAFGYGGGVYSGSRSLFDKVIFLRNRAKGGGGMTFYKNTGLLTGVVFLSNTATSSGAGLLLNSINPVIVNSIFWGNRKGTESDQFSFHNYNSNVAGQINIFNNVIEDGIPIAYLKGGSDNYFRINTTNPRLEIISGSGGSFEGLKIPLGSSAVDKGLYVKYDSSMRYYSSDGDHWYKNPSLFDMDGNVTPPWDATDLTATDITGYPVNGLPDIGVYEARN